MNKRIAVYDRDCPFKLFIVLKGKIGHYIHVSRHSDIFMYSGGRSPTGRIDFDTIYKFDMEGSLNASFAPFPEEAKDIILCTMRDGMVIDGKDFIHELNTLFYRVRKYSAAGNSTIHIEKWDEDAAGPDIKIRRLFLTG